MKPTPLSMTQWIDLSQPRLGGEVTDVSDDFFADKSRLIDPRDPVFIPDKYDDNGKWMDGWESRRRRGGGHDYCIVRLGKRGIIKGFLIDTSHFTGNYPPYASIDACDIRKPLPDDDTKWETLVPKMALNGDSQHPVEIYNDNAWTHVRLNIYPDGGVARLRVYGRVEKDWSIHNKSELIDLAAMENGGRPIICNNEHYGVLGNIIAPGKGVNMGDGWETRRRREPGHDWGILELCHEGIVKEILLDTAFFKGNYPDRVFIQGTRLRRANDATLVEGSSDWPILLPEQKMKMDSEHFYREEVQNIGPITHVRVNMIPDGGISRLRLLGHIVRVVP